MTERRIGFGRLVVGIVSSWWVATVLAAPVVAQKNPPEVAERALSEVPETELLDVDIEVFSPGLPPGDEDALEEKGIFADVRRSEARYMPVLLAATLQETGYWGAVRVVPPDSETLDVHVRGRIETSSGLRLELHVAASDATGRSWLEKKYKGLAGL